VFGEDCGVVRYACAGVVLVFCVGRVCGIAGFRVVVLEQRRG
jgi:hypothetical protein